MKRSNESQVLLTGLKLQSSGRYRCEVSAEAPSFQTVSEHGDMITVGEYIFVITKVCFYFIYPIVLLNKVLLIQRIG